MVCIGFVGRNGRGGEGATIGKPILPKYIQDVLEEYQDVLIKELSQGLLPRREVDHKIEVQPEAKSPSKPPYWLNQNELMGLKKQPNGLLARKYVGPNKSSYGIPMFFVDKKDGKLHICIDYRALNKVTIKNNYLLPQIDDLFDRLAEVKYFSHIDLNSEYYQIRVADEDVKKTVCCICGSYEFLVMPFRLCIAPLTFITFIVR